jgi:hypothetical protein
MHGRTLCQEIIAGWHTGTVYYERARVRKILSGRMLLIHATSIVRRRLSDTLENTVMKCCQGNK